MLTIHFRMLEKTGQSWKPHRQRSLAGSMGSQRVGHDWATNTNMQIYCFHDVTYKLNAFNITTMSHNVGYNSTKVYIKDQIQLWIIKTFAK